MQGVTYFSCEKKEGEEELNSMFCFLCVKHCRWQTWLSESGRYCLPVFFVRKRFNPFFKVFRGLVKIAYLSIAGRIRVTK